jgi:hypothetical protein|tara:strand:+ start:96 stop:218 length:123 start_codon:yes stop_codon:yes gene_type:complete
MDDTIEQGAKWGAGFALGWVAVSIGLGVAGITLAYLLNNR